MEERVKKVVGYDDYVYDISLDGTFVDAFTGLVAKNTDGFNFKLPDEDKYRFTKEHPYIGKGSNREVKLGKEYVGYEADVAEFNDLYMKDVYSPYGVQKMGLGIDEIVTSTINFSRKNYADYFPENPYPEDVKMVGNTIKSKKMPEYIAKFLAVGIRMLLRGEGKNFIEYYYDYVDKIYNYRIPLKDIATKGKIKKSIEQYLKDIKEVTKAGRPKSRQAWYELAIKNGLKVDNGDTIYYINIGKSKSHADVKKITRYFQEDMFGGKIDITKEVEKGLKQYKKDNPSDKKITKLDYLKKRYMGATVEEEIVMNCALVPREIIESEDDKFCDSFIVDGKQTLYNCPKYIDAFNKRIKPLLVCFSKNIRSEILITNPDDRNSFTEEECELVSGEPYKMTDQDTYEQLMTMEDKEIVFWMENGLVPPFLEACGMGTWEDIQADYLRRMEEEKRLGVDKDREAYNQIIREMTDEEVEKFLCEGELPEKLFTVIDINPLDGSFVSRKYPDMVIGNVADLTDLEFRKAGDTHDDMADNTTTE